MATRRAEQTQPAPAPRPGPSGPGEGDLPATGPVPAWPRSVPARLALLLAAGVAVALRVISLRSLQAEFYGDIAIVREYVDLVLAGAWPFHFTLSSGPLYHYLVVPVVALLGPGYFGLKAASVVASLGVLAATFALARRLGGDRLALLSLFVAGVSSWLLIFSRLGNSQILVPLLATTSLWLLVRFVQERRRGDLVLSAAVAGLGLYSYPQSFVLAPVMAATLLALRLCGLRVRWRDLGLYGLASLIVALPFVWIVRRDPVNFFSGYIGGKLQSPEELTGLLLVNLKSAALSFHVHGDTVFRSNPSGRPHVDAVSGVLLLLGVVFWLLPERRRWSGAIFVPFLLQHVPSVLVKAAGEVPSASRTLGAAPEAYLLVASGALLVMRLAARFRGAPQAAAALLLAAILGANVHRYFSEYLPGLPYANTPIGAYVSRYANSLPPRTDLYLVDCCWKEGMPEPKGVLFDLDRPRRLHLLRRDEVSCRTLESLPEPAVVIWDFAQPLPGPGLEACASWLSVALHESPEGRPLFHSAPLRRDRPGRP
jgi:hypothetical protein